MTAFSDDILTKLVFDLTTIGKFKQGDVIDTTNEYINLRVCSLRTSLDRTITGDDRTKALQRFEDRIGAAFEFAERILESRHLSIYDLSGLKGNHSCISIAQLRAYQIRYEWLLKIYRSLLTAIPGLTAFKCTYEQKNDSTIVGKCAHFIASVERKVNALKQELDNLDRTREDFELISSDLRSGSD